MASNKYSEYYKPRDPYKQALYSFDGCRLTTELQICLAVAALYSSHGEKFDKERFFNKAYYCSLIFKTHLCRTVALREGQDPYNAPHVKIRHHTITNWNCREAYKLVAIEQVVQFLDEISPLLKSDIELHQVLDLLHQAVFDVLSQSATCAMKVFRDFSDEQRREHARYAVMDKELYAAADYEVDADTIGYKQEEEYANEYGYDIDDIYGEGYYNKFHDAPDPQPYDAKQPHFAYAQKSTILYPDSARYLLKEGDPYRPPLAYRPKFMSPYSARRKSHYNTNAKSYGFLPKETNYFLSLKNADSEGDIIEARMHEKCLGMDVCGERCSWRPIPDCCWDNKVNCNASSLTDCRIYGNHKVLDHPLQGFVKKKYMRTQAYYDPLNRYLQKEKAFLVCKKAHAYGKNDVNGLCVGVGYFVRDLDTGKRHRVKVGGIANALDEVGKKNRQFSCVEFKWHPSSLDCSCSLMRIRLEMETYCCKLSQDYVHPLVEVIDLYSSSSFPFYTTDHKLDAQNCNVSAVKMYKNQQILGLHIKGVVLSVEGCEQPVVVVEQVVDDVLQRSLKYYN